ncbi:MAG: hypothetical protein ACRD51_01250 [Candidatus Acidiferrum sp.]
MRILQIIGFSALLVALLSPCLEARGGLGIALLANTQVQNDVILLANLLPEGTSGRIRHEAEKISLGQAPQPGSTREFTRGALTAVLSASSLSPADFEIPRAITVRRAGRLISRREVFEAIQSALARNPIQGIPALRLQDVSMEAAVRVPPGDPGLEVTQITFDHFLRRARVRLWPRSAPGVLPFFVTIKAAGSFFGQSIAPRIVAIAAHPTGLTSNSTPVFVPMNRLAHLHIHSADLDMLLEVRPLQRGYLGEVIRVRLPGTGRTLQARVTGVGYLDATL